MTGLVFSVWQTALLLKSPFHHSNVDLAIETERWLCRLVVTPRMYGIHHSIIPAETNSNWSSALTLWDWLHGTLRLNEPQDDITIGVPAYRDPAEVTLPHLLIMAFEEPRPSERLPGDGEPARVPPAIPQDFLLA